MKRARHRAGTLGARSNSTRAKRKRSPVLYRLIGVWLIGKHADDRAPKALCPTRRLRASGVRQSTCIRAPARQERARGSGPAPLQLHLIPKNILHRHCDEIAVTNRGCTSTAMRSRRCCLATPQAIGGLRALERFWTAVELGS